MSKVKKTTITYGRLYNWYAVENSAVNTGFITGWRVPSRADIGALATHMLAQGITEATFGKALKSARLSSTNIHPRWDVYSGISNNDTIGFNAMPGGFARGDASAFIQIGQTMQYWISEALSSTNAYYIQLSYTIDILQGYVHSPQSFANQTKKHGFHVRLVKDYVSGPTEGVVMDANGYEYAFKKIGTQLWITDNLRCTKYANGVTIPSFTASNFQSLLTHGQASYNTTPIETVTTNSGNGTTHFVEVKYN